jgi:hypothetical protein
MPTSTKPYCAAYLNAFSGRVNWTGGGIKVALLASYTPSQAHRWFIDVNGTEVPNGNGYSTGGLLLPNPTNVILASSGMQILGGNNAVWTSSGPGFSTSFGVVYDSLPGNPSIDPLIGYIDFGGPNTPAGGTQFVISWSSSGIFGIQVTVS